MKGSYLQIIGVDHKHNSLSEREEWSWSVAKQQSIAQQLLDEGWCSECLIIVTCYRTEIVCIYTMNQYRKRSWHRLLPPKNQVFLLQQLEAINHILATCVGLQSKILGETQVFGQVKAAYEQAVSSGCVKKNLHYLCQRLWAETKVIRTRTNIGQYSQSLGALVYKHMYDRCHDMSLCTVLCLGTGEMISDLVSAWQNRTIKQVIVISRTPKEKQAKFNHFGVSVQGYDQLPKLLNTVQAVVCATTSNGYLIKPSMIKAANISICVDLSVPRNIHPEVKSIPGLALLNIDDVNYKLNQNSQLKSQAAQKACKEVKQKSVQLFTEWQQRDLIYNDKKEVRKGC